MNTVDEKIHFAKIAKIVLNFFSEKCWFALKIVDIYCFLALFAD